MRKVVRRGKGEEGGQELIIEGLPQDFNEEDVDGEQFMSYAVLGRDSKVGFWVRWADTVWFEGE